MAELDGFAAEYFAYHEDTELSLRLWQRGLRLEYVPDAVVRHHYEFSRNDLKLYLVERNRLVDPAHRVPGPDTGVARPDAAAHRGRHAHRRCRRWRWTRQQPRGWGWLWRNRYWVGGRRRQLQAERRVPDGVIAELMTARVAPLERRLAPAGMGVFNAVAGGYWALARPLLQRRGPPTRNGAGAPKRARHSGRT